MTTPTFPLADAVPGHLKPTNIRAVSTGEYRPVKPGEWYLSGANVAAYRAPNGTDHPYQIAKLVRARRIEYWELGEDIEDRE